MGRVVQKGLGIAVAIAAGLSVGVLIGVVPALPGARPSERPFDARLAVTPARALPDAAVAQHETEKQDAPTPERLLPLASLCEAPGYGTMLSTLKLGDAGDEHLAVWCRGGYALFTVRELASEAPRIEQIAFFSTRSEAPGGVAAGDFDADGVPDLALGVAPRPPLVHRAGAGVFFLRGRKEGGFEAPRAWVETPTIALHARKSGHGHGLWVLTRGEPAAQRAGEIWMFSSGPAAARTAVLQGVVDPRDWLFLAHGENEQDVWVVSGDPGALVRVRVRDHAELPDARRSIALRGAQEWVGGSTAERALVRDGANLLRLDTSADEPSTQPFASQVRVGPASLVDIDGDARAEVVAALPEGAAIVNEAGAVRDLHLPEGLAVNAVRVLHDATGRAHAVLLVRTEEGAAKLAIAFPGNVPDDQRTVLRVAPVAVSQAAFPVSIALE